MFATLNPAPLSYPVECPEDDRRSSVRLMPGRRLFCEVRSGGTAVRARRVLNISEGGIRLLLDVPVCPGAALEVRLYILGAPHGFAAEVMYTHRDARENYVVGAAFRQSLSPRLLEMLV